MGSVTGRSPGKHGTRVPWGEVLLSSVAAVSWALIAMAGTAALGLHLLRADAAGSLGPMTAAVVALGAGGAVTPSADASAFGLTGAEAQTAIEITPLGVSLVGSLLLSWFFLRSLRTAGVVVAPAELLARAGAVLLLFAAMLGGLAWAGHDVVTLDGGPLGLGDLPGGGTLGVPGLGDAGGLLPDRIGDLVDARAAVGFTVDTGPTLLGGLCWAGGVLLVTLLASRRTPLPRGFEAVHRVVRPAVSALVTVLVVAVAAGLAAALYAAAGDDHPGRIVGAALLGAPNGVWLGVPIGLFVPWDGTATGGPARLLPDPLGDLLAAGTGRPVTLGRLADLDGRVWLLGVAAALLMLLAGVLTAARTAVPGGRAWRGSWPGAGVPGTADRPVGALGSAGRCAVRLGIATALTLPLLARLTEVSADASLSVLGFDAFGAGIELHGRYGAALVLGALWGAGAGAVGALLAHATGAAGTGAREAGAGPRASDYGPYGPGAGGREPGAGACEPGSGPYAPGVPYRPPHAGTNPYLRLPERPREPEDARPGSGGAGEGAARGGAGDGEPSGREDVHGAPTVAGPMGPLPPVAPRGPGGRRGGRGSSSDGAGPMPPPPPPPPPLGRPGRPR